MFSVIVSEEPYVLFSSLLIVSDPCTAVHTVHTIACIICRISYMYNHMCVQYLIIEYISNLKKKVLPKNYENASEFGLCF